MVVEAERAFADAGVFCGHLEAALRSSCGDREILVTTKEGRLVCVVPGEASVRAQRGSAAPPRTALNQISRIVAADTPTRGNWRMGVGRARDGSRGICRSFVDATEALAFARQLQLSADVVHAEQLLVYRVLFRDRSAMTDLVGAVLGSLTNARGGAEPMLDTLAAYFATGGVTAAAARRLHLSVRALTYRLQRIAELTGYSVAEPTQRLSLEVAVVGARALDWPRQPLRGDT